MSVLRSSALGTGATALRAVGGTAVGFIVGSVHHGRRSPITRCFCGWFFPSRCCVSGMAPSMISFAAGQAAFTVGGDHPVQHHSARRVEGRTDEDRGRGHRMRGEHRCRCAVLAPGRHRSTRPRPVRRRSWRAPRYLADAVERLTVTSRHVDTEPANRRHTAPTSCSTTPSASSSPSVEPRWSRSRPSPGSSPGRIGSGWRPSRSPRSRPPSGRRANPRSSRSPSPRRSCGFVRGHATAGTRGSPISCPIGATVLDEPVSHGAVLHDVLRRRSRTFGSSSDRIGCRRRYRCCGLTSSWRTRPDAGRPPGFGRSLRPRQATRPLI